MRHPRRGFTLVEMLVVISLFIVLATLALVVSPNFGERQRANTGAEQFSKWLLIAKSRAQRDGRPNGVRFVPTTSYDQDFTATTHAKHFQYVEQPDDLVGARTAAADARGELVYKISTPSTNPAARRYQQQLLIAPPPPPAAVNYPPTITQSPYAAADPTIGTVGDIAAGDVVVFSELNVRRVVAAATPDPVSGRIVSLLLYDTNTLAFPESGLVVGVSDQRDVTTSALTAPARSRVAYRVVRAARPLAGEPQLTLPRGVAIDTYNFAGPGTPAARSIPAFNTGGTLPFDVLFAPTGQVIGATTGRVCLWVRDITQTTDVTGTIAVDQQPATLAAAQAVPRGENNIVTVYTRTGVIAVHPLNVDDVNPNKATQPFKLSTDPTAAGL